MGGIRTGQPAHDVEYEIAVVLHEDGAGICASGPGGPFRTGSRIVNNEVSILLHRGMVIGQDWRARWLVNFHHAAQGIRAGAALFSRFVGGLRAVSVDGDGGCDVVGNLTDAAILPGGFVGTTESVI